MAATGVSFVLLITGAGPLLLALALLGFGLSLHTAGTLRDLIETRDAARPRPERSSLQARARAPRRPARADRTRHIRPRKKRRPQGARRIQRPDRAG